MLTQLTGKISDTIQHQVIEATKMIIRNIKMNFHKIITGYGFYICVLFTAILCFSANIYEDFGNGNKYSAIASLLNFDREFMLSDTSFCSFEVMRKGAGSWLSMFIPIISAFAFVPLVCDEYEAKSVRFEIFRSSKLCYHTSRFVTACLCGGLAVMLGFGLFTLTEYALFPNINEYEESLKTMYEEGLSYQYPSILQSGYAIIVLEKLGDMFLYGVVCVAPVIMMTSIIRNKYLVMCIPFFLKYAINQTCIKLQSQAISDIENTDTKLLKISSIVNPDALSYLSEYGDDKKLVLIYSGFIVFAALAFYLIICARRLDSGE